MRTYAPSKKMVVKVMSFLFISKLIWLLEPYVLWKMINLVQLGWRDARTSILWLLLLYGGLNFFWWVFHGTWRVREETMKFRVAEAYSADMFHKICSLPMQRQTDNHSWKTIDKVNKSMHALREFSWSNFMYMNTIVPCVWSLISLFLIRRPAGILLIILSWINFLIVIRFDKKIVPLLRERNKKEHVVMSTFFDFLSNIKTVIALRFEWSALETLKKKISLVFPPYAKYIRLNERKRFSMDMMLSISFVVVIWLYIWTELSSEWVVLIWTMTMLMQYTERMKQAFHNFTWQYSWLITKKTDMETVDDIERAYQQLAPTYRVDLLHSWDEILIRDLRFSYTTATPQTWSSISTKKTVLSWVDMNLVPWRKIALVWESGSGKSTLMSLLRWLYDVDYVKLMIDKKRYDDLHPLAHVTSLIPQEPEIFENTIRYNISMGLDISDDEIMKYICMARFEETLAELPDGLDTDIKEKWVNLSWWQKQRLALARWLLMARSSDIILLDESTSSVDPINEKKIYASIFTVFSEPCFIASIHKLHLLELFDMIYVLDAWSVIEEWSFQELYEKWWAFTAMREEYESKEKN